MTTAGMFRRLLVPIELASIEKDEVGTDRAVEVGDHDWIGVGGCTVRALQIAAGLAGEGGELWLVHAHHDFAQYATWMTPERMAELNAAAGRDATAVLDSIARRHCPGASLRHVVEPGRPLDVILAAAREHPPDAIVLAASSRGKVDRAFLGSTADKIIRRAPCPVLVVPAGTP